MGDWEFRAHYFCTQCKASGEKLGKFFKVEEDTSALFCSEECILKFYSGLIEHVERQVTDFKIALHEPDLRARISDDGLAELLDRALEKPTRIVSRVDDLGRHIFLHILDLDQGLSLVCFCLHSGKRVSLLLHHFLTRLAEAFERAFVSESMEESLVMPPDVVASLEMKKSRLLADYIENRRGDDLELDQLDDVSYLVNEGLRDPDEVFEFLDEEEDKLRCYGKAHRYRGETFYFVMVCYLVEQEQGDEDVVIPILHFPTTDSDLYDHFKRGECIKALLRN